MKTSCYLQYLKDKHENHIPFIPNISLSICSIIYLGIKNCWTESRMIQNHTRQRSFYQQLIICQYRQAHHIIYFFLFFFFLRRSPLGVLPTYSYSWSSCFLGLLRNGHSRASIHHHLEIFQFSFVGFLVCWMDLMLSS